MYYHLHLFILPHTSNSSMSYARILLETDPNQIAEKVASHSMDSGAPLSEQVFDSTTF